MRSLQFQRLVLISDSKNLANQFEFPKRLNLVTGNDNSIGKSTLVKNLFWALGCDPEFDEEWKTNDIKAILYFTVDNILYIASRYHDSIIFGQADSQLKKYPKITGEYSQIFSDIVNFDLKLVNRSDDLECPPPAYYFLPFYIDQKRSWNQPWNSFDKLMQFSSFKRPLISYVCGYTKSEHFEMQEELFIQKAIIKEANEQIERISSAIQVIEDISNDKRTIALSEEELNNVQNEIEIELQNFLEKQTRLFDTQTQINSELYDLEKQYGIALNSVRELEKDYAFAVEYIPEDVLECPMCGTKHDNSLLSRAGILTDKSIVEEEAGLIRNSLNLKRVALKNLQDELQEVRFEINRINEKYVTSLPEIANSNYDMQNAIHSIALKNVSHNVSEIIVSHESKSKQAEKIQKEIKSDQNKLLSKKQKDELNTYFFKNLEKNIETLSATGINLHGVKTPMDFKKLLGGGAAEATRGVLAYQLAILKQIEFANSCAIAPFVIDTPNQHEQAAANYLKIINLLKSNLSSQYQVILCGMDHIALDEFKKDCNIIKLDKDKLLKSSQYEILKAEYNRILEAIN
ncbi:hypothetical protein KTH44_10940 [Acinetobacter bereziniae]|uniref:hypothetical protein n=1 Tax=Acinetobacter bereziniae TaxID=106648 RepID=UPI0021CD3994|nr:hypothetical protein [Acinetobacter bereziniae]MCU4319641.1 hypothetical protein [Acinetobacter bereziniae]